MLKLAVQRLESEVNQGLASRSQQSERRRVSNEVPFPISLEAKPGFRQVEINIGPAPGLGGHPRRQLLFYELQHDTDPAFSAPTTLETPQQHVVVGGLGLGESRSFRARVINTFNEASPWSTTRTVTVAQSQIQQTYLPEASVRLEHPIGSFQPILEATFQPVEANACINAHIAVLGPHFDIQQRRLGQLRKTFFGGPAHVQIRWKVGVFNEATGFFETQEIGQRAMLSVRPGYSAATDDFHAVRSPLSFGTIVTPWFKLPAGSTVAVRLEAAKCPGSEWLGPTRARASQTTEPVVFVRNGQIIEVLQDL